MTLKTLIKLCHYEAIAIWEYERVCVNDEGEEVLCGECEYCGSAEECETHRTAEKKKTLYEGCAEDTPIKFGDLNVVSIGVEELTLRAQKGSGKRFYKDARISIEVMR